MKTQNILTLFIILLVTGGLFYFMNMPEPPETAEVQEFVWMIEMEDIDHITLEAPREGKSESCSRRGMGTSVRAYSCS